MKYQALFETMTAGVIYQDAAGIITDANPAARRLHGLSLDELQGRTSLDTPWRAIHEDGTDFPCEAHPFVVARQTGMPVHDVVIGIANARSDEYVWIQVNAIPQFHPGETTPYQVYATFDDLTVRTQRDDALAQLAALVDASDDAIVSKTLDGIIVGWNASATRLYGYTAECVGQPIDILVPAERQAELDDILERIGRGECVEPFETVRLHKDGTPIAVSLTVSPIKTAAGRIVGAYDLARDISARIQVEEVVRTLNTTLEPRIKERTAQLEDAVKELEAFSYSVSHDLRAPLRAVDGFSRILLSEYAAQLPEEARGYLNRVKANAEHMGQLIDDLLTFSRLNREPVQRVRIDPASLARQALEELALAGDARTEAVTIKALLPCTGDPVLLQQVFVNLLSNALKFTAHQPAPRITLGCHAGPSADVAPVYLGVFA